jgi:hypothetical protein
VSVANTASTNASSAVTTANSASTTANQAIAAVSNAVLFDLVADVSSIPSSPSDGDYVEVGDSTGIGSFTPLAGLPSGFVGDSGLTVRIRFTSSGSTWNYLSYFANNPETRYLQLAGGTVTGDLTVASQGDLRLQDSGNTHYVALQAPATVAADVTFTLPDSDGANGQFLVTSGTGQLSWGTPSPGVTLVDGGNFANGASAVSTTQLIDGGAF